VDGRLPYGLAQAAFFGLLLVGIVGFMAVLVGFGVWLGLGSIIGWAEVEIVRTAPDGAVLLGRAALLIGTALNVFVQESIFTGRRPR